MSVSPALLAISQAPIKKGQTVRIRPLALVLGGHFEKQSFERICQRARGRQLDAPAALTGFSSWSVTMNF